MNEVQAVQLDILHVFSHIMQREGLTWFAMFGTLLGASRHGGFIPWDDDIDVAMPRRDYNRLRNMPEIFHEPYFLQTTANDPGAVPHYMRLRHSGTAYITDFPSNTARGGHMGIYIDIIPLDIVPDTVVAQRIQSAAKVFHAQMCASVAFDESDDGEMSDFIEDFCYKNAGLPGHYSIFADCYEKTCASFSAGHYYAMPALCGTRGTRVYDRAWFERSTSMTFEGMQVPVPFGWKEVLIVSYPQGLYIRSPKYVPPAPDNQGLIIDTQRSFREYTRRYTDMLVCTAGKKIFLFGAGDSLRIWLERYGKDMNVVCTFDNAPAKWGTTAYNIPVRSPEEIPELLDEDSRLIIVSMYYKEISQQLDNINVRDYFVFIDGWRYGKAPS